MRKQNLLCNKLVTEAKSLIDDGKVDDAGLAPIQGQAGPAAQQGSASPAGGAGQPRALDKAELSFYQDTRKGDLFLLKEEMYFTIDERAQEAPTCPSRAAPS